MRLDNYTTGDELDDSDSRRDMDQRGKLPLPQPKKQPKEYRQPSWLHAGPNLTYDKLHSSYRAYLEIKVREDKGFVGSFVVSPEDIVEHAIEYWIAKPSICYEARGFFLAQNGEYPSTEGIMFNCWFFREMHKKMCELHWLDDVSSQYEFFERLGWRESI